MKKLEVYFHNKYTGVFKKIESDKIYYEFEYDNNYKGPPISLTMPLSQQKYTYTAFPPFFDNLLPEGGQLKALLRNYSLSPSDYFSQLAILGEDLIGAVTVKQL